MQVEPDDVTDLALQLRVGGELEGLRPPGLHANRCQILATVACEIGVPSPASAAASSREDRWVAPYWVGGSVRVSWQHPIP